MNQAMTHEQGVIKKLLVRVDKILPMQPNAFYTFIGDFGIDVVTKALGHNNKKEWE